MGMRTRKATRPQSRWFYQAHHSPGSLVAGSCGRALATLTPALGAAILDEVPGCGVTRCACCSVVCASLVELCRADRVGVDHLRFGVGPCECGWGWRGELGHGFLGQVAAFGDLPLVVGLDEHAGGQA
jgi:hypothetical protein